ncbi:hypothetical protein AAHE18_03G214200 [Arachis hypogaea]
MAAAEMNSGGSDAEQKRQRSDAHSLRALFISLWVCSTTTVVPSIDDDGNSDHTSGDGDGPSHLCRELPSRSCLSLPPSHSTANLSLSLVLDGDGNGFLLHRVIMTATQWQCGTAPHLRVFSFSTSSHLDRPHSLSLLCEHRLQQRLPALSAPSPLSVRFCGCVRVLL